MAEADEIVVLDTGSTDETVELLRKNGVRVVQETISPWRFDTARNRSLELVPEDADLCVCTDLDEVFHSGWRSAMEQAWRPGVRQLRYRYTWNFNPDGSEGYVFWIDNVHTRSGFEWVNPVHEVLRWEGDGVCPAVFAPGVQLDHHADESKSRGQYLPLLEQAVREDPHNDRNMHYLGREYYYYHRWADCIRTMERHLEMPEAVWADERCASMRYLAKSCEALGRKEEAEQWLQRAVAQAPYLREPYLDFAGFLAREKQWDGVVALSRRALNIQQRPQSYICEGDAWSWLPYDLLALGLYYTGRRAEALEAGEQAAKLGSWVKRLQENLAFYQAGT